MPARRADAPTQPLPTLGHPPEPRALFGRLAIVTAAGWISGGALIAAQYTAAAAQAPRLVRGAAWCAASLCLFAAAACFACCAALAIAAVAVHLARAAETRRRILYTGADPELAAARGRFASLAVQAAAIGEQASGAPQARALRLAGARSPRRDRHGA